MAGLSDLDHIYGLLVEFYAKQGGIYGISIDPDSVRRTILHTIVEGVVVVGQSSVGGALITPFPFNHQAMIATVVFWYFKSHREIGVFRVLADACRADGATHLWAASHPPDHRIGRHYKKLGLHEVEGQWVCALK